MSLNIPKFLIPSLVGVTVYLIVDKLFPEERQTFEQDLLKSRNPITVRGGNNTFKANFSKA